MLGNDVKVQTVIHIGTVAFFALMCMFVCVRYECMSCCFCTFFLEFVSCVGFRFLCLCASMIVLGDLVAGVTNCEVIIMCLNSWFTTQRGSLTLQLPYITLSPTHATRYREFLVFHFH